MGLGLDSGHEANIAVYSKHHTVNTLWSTNNTMLDTRISHNHAKKQHNVATVTLTCTQTVPSCCQMISSSATATQAQTGIMNCNTERVH